MTTKTRMTLWSMLVWAYLRQRVVEETGRDLGDASSEAASRTTERHGRSTDGVPRALSIARYGVTLDGKGPTGLASRIHPDAEGLHAVVCLLPRQQARAVIDAARQGEIPMPCLTVPVYRAVPNR